MALGLLMAGVGLAKGIYQGITGARQNQAANRLKMSSFTKDFMANRDLAMNQAYSRRSPGQAFAEEQIRRNTANQVGNAMRMAGGDVNKIAAISSAANANANDAVTRLQVQGDAFSQRAFDRLYMANRDIAGGRQAYRNAKNALRSSSQQNLFNAIGSVGEGVSDSFQMKMLGDMYGGGQGGSKRTIGLPGY